jgi:hypothetical protein
VQVQQLLFAAVQLDSGAAVQQLCDELVPKLPRPMVQRWFSKRWKWASMKH